jgi:NAD(P)-dependent dehydrogenase (short-subunit alcohol dehydrogenase family)
MHIEHSIALVTGATTEVGYAAARAVPGEGWQEIVVTERSLGGAQETAAPVAPEYLSRIKPFGRPEESFATLVTPRYETPCIAAAIIVLSRM